MNTLINIPFHSKPLCLIDADGKPYVAMRPIVDGMGLAWPPQERKLKNRFNRNHLGYSCPRRETAADALPALCLWHSGSLKGET